MVMVAICLVRVATSSVSASTQSISCCTAADFSSGFSLASIVVGNLACCIRKLPKSSISPAAHNRLLISVGRPVRK